MAETARIYVGSLTPIGTVALSLNSVRGEGGPRDPRLLLPLTVTLDPRPPGQMIALLDLTCQLHRTPPGVQASETNQVGSPVTVNLLPGLRCRSLPSGPNDQQVMVRIPLTQPLITSLEAHRHTMPAADYLGALRLSATVAWVRETWEPQFFDAQSSPFPHGFGMLSTFAPFWTTQIEALDLRVPASAWVSNVLPGLGLDHLRLIELELPSTNGSLPDTLLPLFDEAQRDFSLGRYRESVAKCRDIRYAIEGHLKAAKARPVYVVVTEQLGLDTATPQSMFLKGLWDTFYEITNAGHHPTSGQRLARADAHACLNLTALLLEYLEQIR